MEPLTSDAFLGLLPVTPLDERIAWNSEQSVTGFSIVRDYPIGCRFVSAVTHNGNTDSKVLIKIGFSHIDIDQDKKVTLFVSASKASKYLLDNHFRYNFEDENSPTEESLKKSDKSSQPVNLTENKRFVFNLVNQTIYDKNKKENISLKNIVNYIYKLHSDTANLKGTLLLKSKMKSRDVLAFLTTGTLVLLWDGLSQIGKKIEKNTPGGLPLDRDNFYLISTQSKYTRKDLVSIPDDQKISLSGSDYKISIKATVLLASIVVLLFLYNYYLPSSFKSLFPLFLKYKNNQLFLGSFLILCYFMLDTIIPSVIIYILNKLIIFNRYLMMKTFSFN
jgi:hypothetical protein